MNSTSSVFNCLYYPFCRCLDGETLKHLLLIFDSVTFIDEAASEEHRRFLMHQMSIVDSEIFSKYEELQDNYAYLLDEKIIQILDPKTIPAHSSKQSVIATKADLEDKSFTNLARQPIRYGLPYRPHYAYGKNHTDRPTWQIFQGKIPKSILEKISSDSLLESHILVPGDEYQSWTFTYEAGSSIALNFYLEAADNLQLVPVTSSELHHELLIHKLKRAFSSKNTVDILDSNDRKRLRASLGYGETIRLFSEIIPSEILKKIELKKIIRFRNESNELRKKCINEINTTLRAIGADPEKAEYDANVLKTINNLKEKLEDSEKKILDIRDKIIPSVAKTIMYGAAGGGTIGALATFLAGLSPGGVLAASSLTFSASLLKEALGLWIEYRKEKRSRSNALSYLAKVSKL